MKEDDTTGKNIMKNQKQKYMKEGIKLKEKESHGQVLMKKNDRR